MRAPASAAGRPRPRPSRGPRRHSLRATTTCTPAAPPQIGTRTPAQPPHFARCGAALDAKDAAPGPERAVRAAFAALIATTARDRQRPAVSCARRAACSAPSAPRPQHLAGPPPHNRRNGLSLLIRLHSRFTTMGLMRIRSTSTLRATHGTSTGAEPASQAHGGASTVASTITAAAHPRSLG